AGEEPAPAWMVVVPVDGHRDRGGLAHDALARDEAEEGRVEAVVAVVAHHEMRAGRPRHGSERGDAGPLEVAEHGVAMAADLFRRRHDASPLRDADVGPLAVV